MKSKTVLDNSEVKYHILIVDDDAFNQYALKQLICTIGEFNCETANNGLEAI